MVKTLPDKKKRRKKVTEIVKTTILLKERKKQKITVPFKECDDPIPSQIAVAVAQIILCLRVWNVLVAVKAQFVSFFAESGNNRPWCLEREGGICSWGERALGTPPD